LVFLATTPFAFQLQDTDARDAPQRRLSELAKARELAYLDLLTPLARHVQERRLGVDDYFIDASRLSVLGNAAAAEIAAEFLRSAALAAVARSGLQRIAREWSAPRRRALRPTDRSR
jgi:hypothetical protein